MTVLDVAQADPARTAPAARSAAASLQRAPRGGPGRALGSAPAFGTRLLFEGYGCPAAQLADVGRTLALLVALPGRIGMRGLLPPCVFRHPSPGRGGEGLSGFVLVEGSRLCLHAYPASRFLHVEISSLEAFDVEVALAELKRTYAPRRVEWRLLDRGASARAAREGAPSRAAAGGIPVTGAIGLEGSR